MKTKMILGAAAVGCALALVVPMYGQMAGHSAAAQAANDPSRNGMASAQGSANQDADWLKTSTEINNGEIAAGNAALSKSSNDSVKQFAQKMIDDHTMLNQKGAPVAQSMGMTPPTNPDKKDAAEMAKMQNLSGPAFDKAYIKAQVAGHKHALALTNQEIANGQNPEVKELATNAKPIIADHLKMAQDLEKKMMASK